MTHLARSGICTEAPNPSAISTLSLVGPRGAGKSTCGALAAEALGLLCVDVDRELERRTGLSVTRLFADRGEPAFRSLEATVTLELLARPGLLVATGGGCVLDPDVRAALASSGTAVWLDAAPVILAARIRGTPRPSLTGAAPEDEIPAVAAARRPHYQSCAALRLDTGALTLSAAVEQICLFFQSVEAQHAG